MSQYTNVRCWCTPNQRQEERMSMKTSGGLLAEFIHCTEHVRTNLYYTETSPLWLTLPRTLGNSTHWVFVCTRTNTVKTMIHFLANKQTLPEWSERYCKSNISITKSYMFHLELVGAPTLYGIFLSLKMRYSDTPTTPMWGGAPGRFSLMWLWCGGHTEEGWCLGSSGNGVSHLCWPWFCV